MRSFVDFLQLAEALWGIPGNDKGYVDHAAIDGHQVHVVYKHHGKGHYSAGVLVNGEYHKPSEKTTPTDIKIARFVRDSADNFVKEKQPTKFTIRGNSKKKKELYRRWASAQSNNTRRVWNGVQIRNPEAHHTPSGNVPKTPDNPMNDVGRMRGDTSSGFSRWFHGKDDKWKWKSKKNKGDIKGGKFELKAAKAVKA